MYQIAEQRWLCKVTDLLKGLCRICICLLYATHRPYPSLACVLMFCIILKMVFAKPAYNVQLLGAVQPHCVSAAETKAHYSLMFTFEKATDRSSYVTAWPHHTSKSQNTYIYIYVYMPALCAWRLIWKCMHWLPWQCCFADVVWSWVFQFAYRQNFKVFQSMIQTFQLLLFFFYARKTFDAVDTLETLH